MFMMHLCCQRRSFDSIQELKKFFSLDRQPQEEVDSKNLLETGVVSRMGTANGILSKKNPKETL